MGILQILILHRIAHTIKETFGVLLDGNIPFCVTLERAWKQNQKNISCIPRGFYLCKRVASPKFGNTFEIKDVPGRSLILFHKGNISDDTHGCIIVGEYFDTQNEINSVKSSGIAFQEFLQRTKDINSFFLMIKGDF